MQSHGAGPLGFVWTVFHEGPGQKEGLASGVESTHENKLHFRGAHTRMGLQDILLCLDTALEHQQLDLDKSTYLKYLQTTSRSWTLEGNI